MLAALDETTPELRDGVAYVVGATVLLADETAARAALADVLTTPGRVRPFHWHREGPQARMRLIECLEALGAVAHVCIHYPTGRKKLEAARARRLRAVVPRLLDDGAAKLLIESRGADQDTRDRSVILDVLKAADRAGALEYDWKPKNEPILWLADGVCGAVREHLLQTPGTSYYERLMEAGVLSEPIYISERVTEEPTVLTLQNA